MWVCVVSLGFVEGTHFEGPPNLARTRIGMLLQATRGRERTPNKKELVPYISSLWIQGKESEGGER